MIPRCRASFPCHYARRLHTPGGESQAFTPTIPLRSAVIGKTLRLPRIPFPPASRSFALWANFNQGITHWTLRAKSCAKRNAVPFGFLCHETSGFFGFFRWCRHSSDYIILSLCNASTRLHFRICLPPR